MLHNVVSLADITSANGKKLDLIFTASSARRHFMLTACDNLEALQKITVARTKVKTSWKSVANIRLWLLDPYGD